MNGVKEEVHWSNQSYQTRKFNVASRDRDHCWLGQRAVEAEVTPGNAEQRYLSAPAVIQIKGHKSLTRYFGLTLAGFLRIGALKVGTRT